MIDSTTVLSGQTWAYTCYSIVILLLMAWFAGSITAEGKGKAVNSALFYSFVGFLTVLGVSLHIVTYNTIPWAAMDLNRGSIKADKHYTIQVVDHKFILPQEKMQAKCNEKVLFDVNSDDLTYGFGVFREDNTMVFQMQVVPGHRNDILWQFTKPGKYTIRSTEYSGPKGVFMIEKNAIEITENEVTIKNL